MCLQDRQGLLKTVPAFHEDFFLKKPSPVINDSPPGSFLNCWPILHSKGNHVSTRLSLLLPLVALAACSGEKKPAAAPDSAPTQTATASHDGPTTSDPRGAIFLNKGCPQCHSISAFGIKSPT